MKQGEKNVQTVSMDNVTRLEGRVPIDKAVFIGIQHVLAMFVGNVSMTIILCGVALYNGNPLTVIQQTSMIQNCMIVAGIASIIQLYPIGRFGAGLPIVMGTSFAFFGVAMTYASQDLGIMLGAVVAGGVIEGILGLSIKYWGHFIKPIISACVVLAIGISVLPSGVTYFGTSDVYEFGAWQNLVVAMVSLVTCLLVQIFGKGVWRQLNVLIGIVVGYIASIFFGMVDFSVLADTIHETGVFAFPKLFAYTPKFEVGAIVAFVLIYIVSAVETMGATSALCTGALKRPATTREIQGSLCVDGFFSAISGGLFGCPSITSYSQNVGLINMTGVVNKYSIMFGMLTLVLAGLFPPIGAFFSTMPYCVLGGCTVVMFGSIVVSGIEMITASGWSTKNTLVVSIALSLGVGTNMVDGFFDKLPAWVGNMFGGNMVAGVFVVALILDLLLPNHIGQEKADNKVEKTEN